MPSGFFLLLTVKMWDEKDKLNGFLSKKELKEDLDNSQPIHIAKTGKLRENTMRRQQSHKKSMGVTHGSNQPSLQKLEIDLGLYQEICCQLGLKWTETGQNEISLLDFWDLQDEKIEIPILLYPCVILQEREEWPWSWLRDLQGSYSQHRPNGQGCLLLGFRAGVLPRASAWLLEGDAATSMGPADRTLSLWGLSYSLKIWWVFSDGFGLEWELWPFLLPDFSLLEWKGLSHGCPSTVFWKQIPYLVSQLEGHSTSEWLITQVLCMLDLDETLDLEGMQ